MRIVRSRGEWTRSSPDGGLEDAVRDILAMVRQGGDDAVRELTERFDHADLGQEELQVSPHEIEGSLGVLDPDVLNALRRTIRNVRVVVQAQLADPVVATLPEGHVVEVVEAPVRRAGLYVPGGRAPYPSTVVMLAVTARVAGVDQIAVCAPPGPGGRAHPAILAACALCEVNEVYRMGGAQAVGALAYGTESVPAVDVIAGPGNAYVQEAKRQVVGQVGIDGIAGPSELAVLASDGADPELIALDLLAQAEHGAESQLWLLSPRRELLAAVERLVGQMAAERPSVAEASLQLIEVKDVNEGLGTAETIAPEHLELMGREAEAFADRVRFAGALYVGAGAGTAFGDYVAGSNHVLPTGGAARFQSSVSAATFRRRMARVSLPAEAAARLAPAGAALARAEGFPVHAESMERRG
jgi:histidinol dehydrogenase